jgi:hypothetical protein
VFVVFNGVGSDWDPHSYHYVGSAEVLVVSDGDKGLVSVFVVSDGVGGGWDPHIYYYIGSVEVLVVSPVLYY